MASFELPRFTGGFDFSGPEFGGYSFLGGDGVFGDIFDSYETLLGDIEEWGQEQIEISEWQEDYMAASADGDGNKMVQLIIDGYKKGYITKEQAIEMAENVQQEANANGGGRINGEMRGKLKEALGIDYDPIAKGKTRAQVGFENFIGGIGDFFSSIF